MPQEEARDEAIRRAVSRLAEEFPGGHDGFEERVARRCEGLGLPAPRDGAARFPLFGTPARLELPGLALTDAAGVPRSQADRILFYHYFAYGGVVEAGAESGTGDELISFRDMKGGAFYWEPFRSRSSLPLARRYGSDLGGLRSAMDRYSWTELPVGDFGARIHGFGNLYLSLVAWSAEAGHEAEFNVLFDPAMRRIYGAEDAAAFASRICLGLL